MSKITNIVVRMYRMGTGDCFVLKFFAGQKQMYKMMIDCGTWSGSSQKLTEYVEDIKTYVDGHLDLLVITHEHKDHVYGFEACKKLFTDHFTIDRIWMGWTEDEDNPKVKKWQKDYGDKKKALALVAKKLHEFANDPDKKNDLSKEENGNSIIQANAAFADAIEGFNQLHNHIDKEYIGPLAGMKVIKKEIAKNNTEYFEPGDIVTNLPKLDGIKFYMLGPPRLWDGEINVDTGGDGESYEHNLKLAENDSFAAAALSLYGNVNDNNNPFDDSFTTIGGNNIAEDFYNSSTAAWRKIDSEWLNSAGNFALRINSITNNLSLAFAIEFIDSGKVLLFPGDAEYGSWASWHKIPWTETCRNGKAHFTEDLLSRTIFYKVAHHLSHNGTAQKGGMEMMSDPDLVAMATLDYNIISPTWKKTMPNKKLIAALIKQTKGRTIIMDEEDIFYDKQNGVLLKDKIKSERASMTSAESNAFKNAFKENRLYFEFNVKG